MAGELTIANMGDALVAETITSEFELKAHESGSFLDHPVIRAGYMGSITGQSSNVISKSVVGLDGVDPLATTSEGAAPGNTSLFFDKLSVTVTKQAKVYAENSDIMQMLLAGRLMISHFVQDAWASRQARLMDMLATEIAGYANPVGDAVSEFDAPTFIAATTAAKVAKMKGPFLMLLHDYQWGQLAMDLGLGTGGVLQWIPATAEMIALKTDSFQGNWLGVDVYTSSRVVTADAAASRVGALLGTFPTIGGGSGSSVLWGDGDFPNGALPTQVNIAGKVLFGLDRGEKEGETSYVSHAYLGTGPGQIGISIKSINAAPA